VTGRPAPGATSPHVDGLRVHLRLNPVRLAFSASPWRSAGYVVTYMLSGWMLFSITLTAAVAAAMLGVTILALPLLIAAAAVVHGCAAVGRGSLAAVISAPVHQARRPAPAGLRARALASWRDVSTWRELAYLVGLWVPLFALDTVALTVWLMCLAGIALPLWYWAPRGQAVVGFVHGSQAHLRGVPIGYFPHGAAGPGAVGLYVDSLPRALLAAAIFAILFMLANYLLVATVRMQARVGRALLRSPTDPLAEAKRVLAMPGPLGPLTTGSGG
jgi:hypothetical protein